MQDKSPTISPSTIAFASLAGFLMILSGAFQAIQGLTAIFNSSFFIVGAETIINIDVTAWGWAHLLVGTIVAIAGISILSGAVWARALGIFLAIISAIANFFYIPYYPFWSILIIALDIGIIGALASFSPENAAMS